MPPQARREAVSSALPRPPAWPAAAEPPSLGLERPERARFHINPLAAGRQNAAINSGTVLWIRRFRRVLNIAGFAGVLALAVAASAVAGWAGRDPAHNYPLGKLPPACTKAPTGRRCIDAGVYYLDRARAKVGLAAYKLPANFPSLT